MDIVAGIFLVLGFFFMAVATLGVLRLPDFYTRMHASGKSETLGMMLSFIGLAIYEGFTLNSLKLLLIVIFVLLGNPIGTHAISRAAYSSGLSPLLGKEKRK